MQSGIVGKVYAQDSGVTCVIWMAGGTYQLLGGSSVIVPKQGVYFLNNSFVPHFYSQNNVITFLSTDAVHFIGSGGDVVHLSPNAVTTNGGLSLQIFPGQCLGGTIDFHGQKVRYEKGQSIDDASKHVRVRGGEFWIGCDGANTTVAFVPDDHYFLRQRLISEDVDHTDRESRIEAQYDLTLTSLDGMPIRSDELDAIERLYALLPAFVTDVPEATGHKHWVFIFGAAPLDSPDEGGHTVGDAVVYITRSTCDSDPRYAKKSCFAYVNTMLHEIIHNHQNDTIESFWCGEQSPCNIVDGFLAASKNDGSYYIGEEGYGLFQGLPVNEAFAYKTTLYMSDPELLRVVAPTMYGFFRDNLFHGREYETVVLDNGLKTIDIKIPGYEQ